MTYFIFIFDTDIVLVISVNSAIECCFVGESRINLHSKSTSQQLKWKQFKVIRIERGSSDAFETYCCLQVLPPPFWTQKSRVTSIL